MSANINHMPLLGQNQPETEVDLQEEIGRIVITTVPHARQGWEESFRVLAGNVGSSFDEDFSGQTEWEKDEWVW